MCYCIWPCYRTWIAIIGGVERRAIPPRPLDPGCKLFLLAGRNIANPKWMRVLGNARVGMFYLAPIFGFSIEGTLVNVLSLAKVQMLEMRGGEPKS